MTRVGLGIVLAGAVLVACSGSGSGSTNDPKAAVDPDVCCFAVESPFVPGQVGTFGQVIFPNVSKDPITLEKVEPLGLVGMDLPVIGAALLTGIGYTGQYEGVAGVSWHNAPPSGTLPVRGFVVPPAVPEPPTEVAPNGTKGFPQVQLVFGFRRDTPLGNDRARFGPIRVTYQRRGMTYVAVIDMEFRLNNFLEQ